MIQLNAKQELAVLLLYSDEIMKLLEFTYTDRALIQHISSLLPSNYIPELADQYPESKKSDYSKHLWQELIQSPTIAVLYPTLLNFLQNVDESLHKIVSMTSSHVRSSSFKLILENVNNLIKVFNVEHVLSYLSTITEEYKKICEKISESIAELEDETQKIKITLRTIPFFGRMAALDLLKAVYNLKNGREIIDKIQPNFVEYYEKINSQRENPDGLVKFYPTTVPASFNNEAKGVCDVDLTWDDFPQTGMKRYLWDNLELRSFAAAPIHLRQYQLELAKDAIAGKNCIIEAPTGSGKTIVASYIIKEHILKRFHTHNFKVLFLVNSTPIIEQQANVISKYLLHKFQVGYTSGIQNLPLIPLINSNDVLVCTPQLILNLLLDTESGISENPDQNFNLTTFSLIIFDECHNTRKCSPYAELMKHYHWMNFTGRHNMPKLPQIIGLTASLGVGNKSRNVQQALEHVVSTCSKLNCKIISRVKHNKTDMQQYIHRPNDMICVMEETHEERENFNALLINFSNVIVTNILSFMQKNNLTPDEICKSENNPNCVRQHRVPDISSEVFDQWVNNHLSKFIPLSCIDGAIKSNITSHFELLLILYRATLIFKDFASIDALKYIENEVVELKLPPMLAESWNSFNTTLKQYATTTSPMIEKVAELLLEQKRIGEDFRAIIFIKTRIGTTILSKILNNRSDLILEGIKSEPLFGTNSKQSGLEKINKIEQAEKLKRFADGVIRVLVTTSTAEEGLDIMCNLVINYNYVTNEIASIQRRGRGRAKNARSIFITCCNNQKNKEQFNMLKEQLMIETLDFLDKIDFQSAVERGIEEELKAIQQNKILKQRQDERAKNNQVYKLICRKCDNEICSSTDIKVYRESMYVVVNPLIWNKVIRRELDELEIEENKYLGVAELLCNNSKCGNFVGRVHKIREVDFPSLKVEAFTLKYTCNNIVKLEKRRKWSKVLELFSPCSLSNYDFANMNKLNSLIFNKAQEIINLSNTCP